MDRVETTPPQTSINSSAGRPVGLSENPLEGLNTQTPAPAASILAGQNAGGLSHLAVPAHSGSPLSQEECWDFSTPVDFPTAEAEPALPGSAWAFTYQPGAGISGMQRPSVRGTKPRAKIMDETSKQRIVPAPAKRARKPAPRVSAQASTA